MPNPAIVHKDSRAQTDAETEKVRGNIHIIVSAVNAHDALVAFVENRLMWYCWGCDLEEDLTKLACDLGLMKEVSNV